MEDQLSLVKRRRDVKRGTGARKMGYLAPPMEDSHPGGRHPDLPSLPTEKLPLSKRITRKRRGTARRGKVSWRGGRTLRMVAAAGPRTPWKVCPHHFALNVLLLRCISCICSCTFSLGHPKNDEIRAYEIFYLKYDSNRLWRLILTVYASHFNISRTLTFLYDIFFQYLIYIRCFPFSA